MSTKVELQNPSFGGALGFLTKTKDIGFQEIQKAFWNLLGYEILTKEDISNANGQMITSCKKNSTILVKKEALKGLKLPLGFLKFSGPLLFSGIYWCSSTNADIGISHCLEI